MWYNKFMTQQQFIFLFNKAKKLMQETKDSVHDWSHIQRVVVNASKIKKLLSKEKQEQVDDKILIIACVWHDVSYVFYKASLVQYFLEGKRCAKICRFYFKQERLPEKEIDLICDIILHHPWSNFKLLNKHRSLYHQIVQDADTLDMFSLERLKQVNKYSKKILYWKFVVKILKPLFLDYFLKNKKRFLNLEESFLIDRTLKHKTIQTLFL